MRLASLVAVAVAQVIWCTTASAPSWLKDTGLALTPSGFLSIDGAFQTSHPGVFAAGDCATNAFDPRPKAGVFAVRAGPVLRENMANFLLRRPLKTHELQRDFLGLISTGDGRAVAR